MVADQDYSNFNYFMSPNYPDTVFDYSSTQTHVSYIEFTIPAGFNTVDVLYGGNDNIITLYVNDVLKDSFDRTGNTVVASKTHTEYGLVSGQKIKISESYAGIMARMKLTFYNAVDVRTLTAGGSLEITEAAVDDLRVYTSDLSADLEQAGAPAAS